MHKRSSLNTRENCLVKVEFISSFLIAENHSASRSPECLMGCRCNNISIRNRTHVKSCCDKSCDMCHINHENCTDLIRYLTEPLEIYCSGISARTCDDKLRAALLCYCKYIIIVYVSVLINSVRNNVKVFSRNIDRTSMCEMSTIGKAHTHNRIAGLNDCEKYCEISLCT